jgi:2-haloacid dehalogenase
VIRLLIFDVFGTLVDWRTGVAREARTVLEPLGIATDWLAFADAWRDRYQPALQEVRTGRIGYAKLDALHRRNLDAVLTKLGLDRVAEEARADLTLAWHRLDAWPDVPPALARLRERFFVAPCSNANISLMVDLARRNGLVWDAIVGAELARDYKPKPAVYLTACAAFDCRPDETLMVAAHSSDLAAAAATGLRTAFIARARERPNAEDSPSLAADFTVPDLGALADSLPAPEPGDC